MNIWMRNIKPKHCISNNWIQILIITLILLLIISDCKKNETPLNPCPFSMAHFSLFLRVSSPTNGALAESISPTLSWSCNGSNLTYDVYFGTAPDSITLIVSNQTTNSIILKGLDLNKTYYWELFAKENIECGLTEETGIMSFTTSLSRMDLPYVITVPANIHFNFPPRVGGKVIYGGSSILTERGVYYGLSTNPEISGTKFQIGSGLGLFSSLLPGLNPSATYYMKAYATNGNGTTLGSEVTFTTRQNTSFQIVKDIEGNDYYTVNIGTQVWMAENLKTTKFNDGTNIPLVTDSTAWSNLKTPGYCWYGNDELNKDTYGALYNWYTMDSVSNGNKNVCPTGWHVPINTEWSELTTYLGGEIIAGGKMKESGYFYWNTQFISGDNSGDFSALPGGYRSGNQPIYIEMGYWGLWWSSTLYTPTHATAMHIYSDDNNNVSGPEMIQNGLSVRCIKNN
jgi:uncharacterized protein (TIGR02145 family)